MHKLFLFLKKTSLQRNLYSFIKYKKRINLIKLYHQKKWNSMKFIEMNFFQCI
jgi:hypothetical protein